MASFLNRPLTFDDLMMPQGGDAVPAPGGVGVTNEAGGGYSLDPRYEAQLATNWTTSAAAPPSPQQIARTSLANALAAGYTNNNREISDAMAWRGRPSHPATSWDEMLSAGTGGYYDKASVIGRAAVDSVLYGDDFNDAYQRDLDERGKWLAQRNSPPSAAGSVEAARAELARGLAAGKNGNGDMYRTAAFRQGSSPATALTPFMNGLSMGWWDELKAAGRAVGDASHGGSFKEAYPHYLAAEQEELDRYRKQNPGTALAAEVAGNLAGMAVPASRLLGVARFVPEAATVGQAVVRGLLNGGAKGFLSGAGNAEGGFGDRLQGGALGIVPGMIMGAVGAPFGFAVRRFFKPDVLDIAARSRETM